MKRQYCHPYVQYNQTERDAEPELSRWALAAELFTSRRHYSSNELVPATWCLTTISKSRTSVQRFGVCPALRAVQENPQNAQYNFSFTGVEICDLQNCLLSLAHRCCCPKPEMNHCLPPMTLICHILCTYFLLCLTFSLLFIPTSVRWWKRWSKSFVVIHQYHYHHRALLGMCSVLSRCKCNVT